MHENVRRALTPSRSSAAKRSEIAVGLAVAVRSAYVQSTTLRRDALGNESLAFEDGLRPFHESDINAFFGEREFVSLLRVCLEGGAALESALLPPRGFSCETILLRSALTDARLRHPLADERYVSGAVAAMLDCLAELPIAPTRLADARWRRLALAAVDAPAALREAQRLAEAQSRASLERMFLALLCFACGLSEGEVAARGTVYAQYCVEQLVCRAELKQIFAAVLGGNAKPFTYSQFKAKMIDGTEMPNGDFENALFEYCAVLRAEPIRRIDYRAESSISERFRECGRAILIPFSSFPTDNRYLTRVETISPSQPQRNALETVPTLQYLAEQSPNATTRREMFGLQIRVNSASPVHAPIANANSDNLFQQIIYEKPAIVRRSILSTPKLTETRLSSNLQSPLSTTHLRENWGEKRETKMEKPISYYNKVFDTQTFSRSNVPAPSLRSPSVHERPKQEVNAPSLRSPSVRERPKQDVNVPAPSLPTHSIEEKPKENVRFTRSSFETPNRTDSAKRKSNSRSKHKNPNRTDSTKQTQTDSYQKRQSARQSLRETPKKPNFDRSLAQSPSKAPPNELAIGETPKRPSSMKKSENGKKKMFVTFVD